MAKCELCAKAGMSGNNVSHSKRRTRTRWFPNMRKANVTLNGVSRRINICMRCLRTQSKVATRA